MIQLHCFLAAGDPRPSLVPLLDTCPSSSVVPSPLLGAAAILDPLGETWLVAITSRGDCAVVDVKPQRLQATPLYLEGTKQSDDEAPEVGVFQTMSRDLLLGPKDIPIPQVILQSCCYYLDLFIPLNSWYCLNVGLPEYKCFRTCPS